MELIYKNRVKCFKLIKLILVLNILFGYFSMTLAAFKNSTKLIFNTGCSSLADPNCLKCNINGCIKCPLLLVIDSRLCVKTCPSGYFEQWTTHPELMGKICRPSEFSGPILAATVGAISGFFVCLILVMAVIYLIRRKQIKKRAQEILIPKNFIDKSNFLRQLEELRPNSECILIMLNDIRGQIRKLYTSGESNAVNSYRPIVRDLAKILIILNRPIELIQEPPNEWNRLCIIAERCIERYKSVTDKLTGLQAKNINSSSFNPRKDTTFRHTISPSNKHHLVLLNPFGSLISLNDFDDYQSSKQGTVSNFLKSDTLQKDLHASSLWLEDEFFKLGLRPQDEITTEL